MDITENTKKKPLTKDEIIQELMDLLKQNNMQSQSNDVFEICSYVDGLEKKLDSMTAELSQVREQIKEMQEDTVLNNLKKSVTEAANRLEMTYHTIKEEIFTIKTNIQTKAADIVSDMKLRGKAALNRMSEIFGIKDKLRGIRIHVKDAEKQVDHTIAKIDDFGKGIREANQQMANTFRTFADKDTVDYATVNQKFSKTEAVKKPFQLKKMILAGMELRLDAAIDTVDNLSKDVEISRMMKQYDEAMAKPHENLAVVPAMVAEAEPVYGADVFETTVQAENSKPKTADVQAPKPKNVSKAR